MGHLPVQPNAHFVLQVQVIGGVDTSYAFDARPLAMTQAGLIQNYVGQEPELWTGVNGQSAWMSPMARALKPYKNDISILNGVVMAPDFDGHDQNLNYLLTGSPFGGESFIPYFNLGEVPTLPVLPLDGIVHGNPGAQTTNTGNVVPLSVKSGAVFLEKLKNSRVFEEGTPLFQFLQERTAAASTGSGRFSAGSRLMHESIRKSPRLIEILKKMETGSTERDQESAFLRLVLEMFKGGATRSAVLVLNPMFGEANVSLDAHDAELGKGHPKGVAWVMEKIASVLRILKETEYEDGRSYLDVTTVLVCSEFGRTMRKLGSPIDDTGTDHNPLANQVLLAGKGIKPGWMIGATDYQAAGETLSGAHLAMDPNKIRTMGKPFDFSTLRPRSDLPVQYVASDYLNIVNVINTLFTACGLPTQRHRKLRGASAVAPPLRDLLA